MIIITFTDMQGVFWVVRNPTQRMVDAIEKTVPNAIMKIYDFESREILTWTVDEFSWMLYRTQFVPRLNDFRSTIATGKIDVLVNGLPTPTYLTAGDVLDALHDSGILDDTYPMLVNKTA